MWRKILDFYENNIQKKLMNIRVDNYVHAFFSVIIFILFVCIFDNWFNTSLSILFAGIINIFLGLFKEYVIDLKIRQYMVDPKDIVSDIVGTLIGMFLYIYQIIV